MLARVSTSDQDSVKLGHTDTCCICAYYFIGLPLRLYISPVRKNLHLTMKDYAAFMQQFESRPRFIILIIIQDDK